MAIRAIRGVVWGLCGAFAIFEIGMLEHRIFCTATLGVPGDSSIQQAVIVALAVAEMLTAYVVARAVDRILALAGESWAARTTR